MRNPKGLQRRDDDLHLCRSCHEASSCRIGPNFEAHHHPFSTSETRGGEKSKFR